MKQELYTLEGRPGLWRVLPFSIQQILAMFVSNLSIFSQNVVAVIFVLTLVLNLILPKNMEG